MKKKLFIFSNESISSQDGKFFCDNIDLKTTPEGLNKEFEVNLFGRKSKISRSHEIKIKKIKIYNNIFSYIFSAIEAAKISFLLSIPTLGAVSVFGLKEIIQSNNLSFSILNLFSILFSFFFSLITIKFFLRYIERFSLNLFVAYRVTLGLFILVLSTL